MVLYVSNYTYSEGAMRATKRATTRGRATGLKGATGRTRRLRRLPQDLAEFYRPIKKPITLRLDADIIAWFQRQGRGYQTRINSALRQLMMAEKK